MTIGNKDLKGCRRCGDCCRFVAIHLPQVHRPEMADLKTWMEHRGRIEGDFWVIRSRCQYLVDTVLPGGEIGGDCRINIRKPKLCRSYPPSDDDWTPARCGFNGL